MTAPISAILRFFRSEVGAIIIWFLSSIVIAALIFPHLYAAGKQLAESAELYSYPALIESIASSAGRAKPDRYLSRALMLGGLICLPLVIWRVKKCSFIGLCCSSQPSEQRNFACGWYFFGGLGIAIFVQAILLHSLNYLGLIHLNAAEWSIDRLFWKAVIPALGAGVIEEILFRGILLGVYQRACSLVWSCIGSSLIFAGCHFLSPPSELVIADPKIWYAGFELIGSIFSQFSDFQAIAPDLISLMAFGFFLAWCRISSGSLCLPIGIHVGFVLALKSFSMLWMIDTSPLASYLFHADAKSGLFPLLVLFLSFGCCVFLNRLVKMPRDTQ